MIAAFEASASEISDSVIPPAPECTMRARTSSVPSLSSAPAMASIEPCTSPLMTSGNSFRPVFCSWRHHLFERTALAGLDGQRPCRGSDAGDIRKFRGRGFRFRRRQTCRRPAACPERPRISTGIAGPASLTCSPLSLTSARTRPHWSPATMIWPGRKRALLDENGGNRTAAAVELGFDDRTFGSAVRIGLQVENFGLQQDGFEQLVEIGAGSWPRLRRRALHRPWIPRTLRAAAARVRTFCGSAVGLSILLIATMIGTPAALAWLIDSIVCGITLSSAATTRMAMSVACAPRARMAVKAAWPGVSMKVILWPFCST